MSLHSLTTSSSFGSALGQRQKFPPEYLAKQLPVFQERVPKVAQVGERGRVKCVCVCVYIHNDQLVQRWSIVCIYRDVCTVGKVAYVFDSGV